MVKNIHNLMLIFCVCFRCLKSEGENEKLQAKGLDLKRKLDDTQAALQEIGRENQSLQVGDLHG